MAKKYYRKKRRKKGNDLDIFIGLFAVGIIYGIFKDAGNVLNTIAPFLITILAVVIAIFVLRKVYLYKKEQEKLNRKLSIDELLYTYKTKPTDFEHYVANVYKKLGYKTEVTPPSNDGGKDIIMFKAGQKYIVEVKLYNHHNWINREQMQKLHSVTIDENAKGIFVTTSSFKKTAIEWAKKSNIDLVDGQELAKLINSINNKNI